MQIFVINLPEDHERRDAIGQQLDGLGLNYEIFPAVRGRDLSPEERASSLDETEYRRNEGRLPTPGELGCALSHLGVYRLIQERRIEHALILEDDAWLNPNLPQLLAAIEASADPTEKEFIQLTWSPALNLSRFTRLWSDYNLTKVKSATCAHGYVVSNAGAGALYEALFPVRHVPDCWNWVIRHRVLTVRAVFPTCITADLSHESNLVGENRRSGSELPLFRRYTRRVWRIFWITYDRISGLCHRMTR